MTMAFRVTGLLTAASLITASTPAFAQDDTAQTGIIAALGLEAASGKTTINDGAGAIEASLLASDAMLQAGAVIAGVTKQAVNGGDKVLVVSRNQQVPLAMVRVIKDRIESVLNRIQSAPCTPEYVAPEKKGGSPYFNKGIDAPKVLASDIAGALATDITISPINFSFEDRLLINAVMLVQQGTSSDWLSVPKASSNFATKSIGQKPKAPTHSASLLVPGEVTDVAASSAIRTNYAAMQKAADNKRGCTDNDTKAAIATVDALTDSLNAAEDGKLSPLETALQLEPLLTPDEKKAERTYVLRVAIEQTGGTAIARSGIWYALGIRGASVVSAGLLASFRLVDPQTGAVVTSGIVRCAVPQTQFGRVQRVVRDNSGKSDKNSETFCAYRTA
jgi:hypothetical protein